MAQKIWIDNGVNVNPAWERHIAYSFDGITWLSINKEMQGVEYGERKGNTSSPIVDKSPVYEIIVLPANTPNVHPALKFSLDLVQNQATWTNDIAGVNNAINDITEWLSQCCGFSAPASATEATLLAVLAAVQAHQDYEFLLVRDPGNSDLIVRQVIEYDETTTTFSYSYEEIDGTPYVPIGSPVYVDDTVLLESIYSELQSLNALFTGAVTSVTKVNISGNAAYVIPAGYHAWQLIVTAGTVTDGIIIYPAGTWGEEGPLLKTLPAGTTLNATGATAYIKLMTI